MSRERDELVETITRAVMERLQGAPAEKPAPPRPSASVASAPPPSVRVTETSDAVTRERLRMFSISGASGPEETRTLHSAGAARVVATVGYCPASDGLASLIDHTLLKPDADRAQIEQLCREAAQYCFASVCVNPNWVPVCRELLKGSGVKVCTVIGFPFGSHLPDVKAYEARRAVEQGAEEVDMVINIGALKSKDYALVEQDIRGVVQAVGKDTVVKVILETALLTREEKIMGSTLAKAAGADFVKTSTGFGGGGATVEDIQLMRETVGPEMGVKASGGVRTKQDVEAMVAAGATRIGASAGVKIVRGEAAAGKGY
ncbi:MAG TPA: deoxyribose-phosphate aldolase [Candidatus Sulfotelmatobacter sp.]|nr:deoxyribose-phosphate aldolase [Candidatus Sulfotelmatobacter sp.]